MSDSQESEDEEEFDCLLSTEKSTSTAKQYQQHDTDEHAAAVASTFLNTACKAARSFHDRHSSSATTLASPGVVISDSRADCSNFDENATPAALVNSKAATNGVLSSAEYATCTISSQNDTDLQPTHDPLQITGMPSVSEAKEEIELTDCIARELDNAACSGLNDSCWDPIDLFLRDKCGTLNDVCNGSLFADLSFNSDCLVEDCSSAQLLACSDVANEVLSDIHQVGITVADNSNQHTSEFTANPDITPCALTAVERSADVVPISSVGAAADGGNHSQSVVSFQQCEPFYSQASTDYSGVIVSVDGEDKSAIIACNSNAVHQRCVSASASTVISSSEPGDQLSSAVHQAANHNGFHSLMLNSVDEHKSLTVHLDVSDNKLLKPIGTDSIVNNELIVSSSDVKVAFENVPDNCDSLVTESAEDLLLSTATRKRLQPEEFPSCKRFRAEDDCLSAVWLASFDGDVHGNVTDNVDTSVLSAASHSHSHNTSSCDEDLHLSNMDELQNICCCSCKLLHAASSLSYCSDGHACCSTCLQHQVKRLLSAPSKARVFSFVFLFCSLCCIVLSIHDVQCL